MPKFTKRHYVAIAEVLADLRTTGATLFTQPEIDRVALALSDGFGRDNDRFNRDRFLSACGTVFDARRKDRK